MDKRKRVSVARRFLMAIKVVSKTVHLGDDAYIRVNADGSYSALAFGSFGPNQVGLKYGWISIPENKVPEKVKQILKGD